MKKEKLIKINEIVNTLNNKEVTLPVITNCSSGFKINDTSNQETENYLSSLFYQTSKMICYSFHKPLYLNRSNDK